MTLYHPAVEDLSLEDVLAALGHPVRMKIVRTLAALSAECPCNVVSLEVTKSTATHHWRVLREAGVIRQRPDGRNVLTGLRAEDLELRFPGLLSCILATEPAPSMDVAHSVAVVEAALPGHTAEPGTEEASTVHDRTADAAR